MSGSQKVGAPRGNQNARRHGAPRGNTNALKHGFYSRSFRLERERLDGGCLGELHDEEQLLHALIARLAGSMEDTMTHEDYVVILRAVSLAVGRLVSLRRSRKAVYINQAALEKIRKVLANPSQGSLQ
jgi:hypothetical protein